MACHMSLTSLSLMNLGLTPRITVSPGRCRAINKSSSLGYLSIQAVQDSQGPRRLVDIIRSVPELSRNYFRSPSRRALFGGISLLGGFYVAQTISLSFGALGVNDVIAAVVCVLLTEYVTRFYYSRPKWHLPLSDIHLAHQEDHSDKLYKMINQALVLNLLFVQFKNNVRSY